MLGEPPDHLHCQNHPVLQSLNRGRSLRVEASGDA
jgi:hypothetical protein